MTLILHGDARAEAIAILKAGLADRAEAYVAGVVVAGTYTGALPSITVTSDGVVERQGRVIDVEGVRVLCWAATEADAHDLSRLARALLLLGSSGQLKACVDGTGPFDTLDNESGTPMSWFTVLAKMQGANVPA